MKLLSGPVAWKIVAAGLALLGLKSDPAPGVELVVVEQRGGWVVDGAAVGEYVYVAQGASVVTLAASAELEESPSSVLGPFPGLVQAVETWRNRLLVGWSRRGRSGVEIFSLRDPARPRFLGPLAVPDEAVSGLEDMALVGDFLYLDGWHLVPVDLSVVPPAIGGPSWSVSGSRQQVLGRDHLVGCGHHSDVFVPVCLVYDLADRMAPELVYDGLVPRGAAGRDWALHVRTVMDMSDPGHPTAVAMLDDRGIESDVARGDLLVRGSAGEVSTWDLSTPSLPRELGRVPAALGAYPGLAVLSRDSRRAWFLSQRTSQRALVTTVDLSVPSVPFDPKGLELPVGVQPRRLAVLGNELLLIDEAQSFRRLDRRLGLLAKLDLLPEADLYDLSVDGDRVLVSREGGVDLLDFADPVSPTLLSTLPVPEPWSVLLADDRAWVVAYHRTGSSFYLFGYDLTDPLRPRWINVVEIGSAVSLYANADADLLIVGDHSSAGGLRFFDVSSPEVVEVGLYAGCSRGADVRGSLAVANCGGRKFHILDVGDAADPQLLGVFETEGSSSSGRAHFLDAETVLLGVQDRIEVVDVSNPTQPTRLSHLEIPGGVAQMVSAEEGSVWVVTMEGGIALLRGRRGTLPVVLDFERRR